MLYYINVFVIYSFLGFLMETALKYSFVPDINTGSMYGPWLPIYGFGACVIIFIMRLVFNRFKLSRFGKIISFFFISFFSLTILELIGGYLAKFIFGRDMWNYNAFKLHIGPYISVEMSLIWGVASLVLIYILKPNIDKLIKKIPKVFSICIFVILVVDLLISTFFPHA